MKLFIKILGKIDLNLIKNFPNASVTINDLLITNQAPFENNTLISAKGIMGTISFSQLFKGFDNGIAIDKLILDQADINILVNEKGETNYNIIKPSTTIETAETEKKQQSLYTIYHIVGKEMFLLQSPI